MSTPDNLVSSVTGRWEKEGSGQRPVTPLPGLSGEAIEGLKSSFPGTLARSLQELLSRTCGLEGTALGSLDFTGQWHDEEPLAVFRPCLTLAVDEEGRRWIAEGASGDALPGPIWCIFSEPQVALYVSEDLASFLSDLKRKTLAGDIDGWLKAKTLEARAVWKHRTSLGLRSGNVSDPALRTWVATLPPDAYVYDLRTPTLARGWPYGVAGPAGRFYRCGRAPVFAVSGPPASDRWARHLSEIASTFPVAQPASAQAAAISRTMPQWPTVPVEHQELRRCA
jgi:hypothetical protein